uniref:Error-prone, lesion bypass DNA polymerase V (UmuC) n=1 Tax=Klebsiella pneumoniae TaxID=573 RepID=A0A8B0SWC2_KLEPN|nr:Error-prone, lesion bypass DNA polymerase V (UmuC) [Klebsiella pneumoniae]
MNPCGRQFASMLNVLRKKIAPRTSILRSGISFHKKTSPFFQKHEPYYSKVSSEQLCIPSRDTRDIIAAAGRALDKNLERRT